MKSRSELVALFPENLISTKELASFFADRLLWAVIAGCIIGARLGHVLFYDFPYYAANPLEVFNLRAGGLASHGGTIGVLLAVYLYAVFYRKRFPELKFLRLLDFIVVPTAFVAFCIRIGNFINQEILGKPTDLPWGVIFGHPAEGGALVPRHPVQLYEGIFYLFTFFLLMALQGRFKPGRLTGLFFLCIFGSRFLLETFKEPQSQVFSENFLLAGQVLSIPFILIGLALLAAPKKLIKT
jgi:prolipoprotein diacylglyceryl transferase